MLTMDLSRSHSCRISSRARLVRCSAGCERSIDQLG
jgi:hypothetical protein